MNIKIKNRYFHLFRDVSGSSSSADYIWKEFLGFCDLPSFPLP